MKKDVIGLGGKQMETILAKIVAGAYSDWVFTVLVPMAGKAVVNNLALLLLMAMYFQKFSKLTKNTYDDYIADKFMSFLTKFQKPKGEDIK